MITVKIETELCTMQEPDYKHTTLGDDLVSAARDGNLKHLLELMSDTNTNNDGADFSVTKIEFLHGVIRSQVLKYVYREDSVQPLFTIFNHTNIST